MNVNNNATCTTSACTPRRYSIKRHPSHAFQPGSLFNELFSLMDDRVPMSASVTKRQSSFPMNVKEVDGGYELQVLLPGVSKEALDLSVEEGALTLSVESTEEHSGECEGYQSCEWSAVKGARTVRLPEDVDSESVEASLADGVLKISLKKRPEKQPKKIAVS